MSTDVYTLHPGRTPLLISLPHVGTVLPESLQGDLVPRALAVEDTDWLLEPLYDFAREMGAGLLVPRHSRYVIDLNRPPQNTPMYPGANNTELCPTRFFTGDPLYRDGRAPDAAAIARRRDTYWQPYHDALAGELARLKVQHGHAVLFDGHSIKSELPWLFEGRLPHMNLGTAGGASCAASLSDQVVAVFAAQKRYSHVLNGRFKGGHITRHYGAPAADVHAVQLEMTWNAYMDERPPFRWHAERAAEVTPLLRAMVQTMIDWKPDA